MTRLLVVLAAALVFARSGDAAIPNVFGGAIACAVQPSGVRFCGGDSTTVPTWDGVTPIDVNVAFPPEPAAGVDGNYPVIGLYHGWGGTKFFFVDMEPLALRGYAVFTMSFRGWGMSCGANDPKTGTAECAAGYNHLLDTRYEVRDGQYLIGRLADEGLVDPRRIGATGASYGGAMSMALAVLKDRVMMPDGSLVPWTTPQGGSPMRIAAAAPEVAWIDLAQAWIPNGHTLDYVTDAPYAKRGRVGVLKLSYVGVLYAIGQQVSNYAAPGSDPDADIIGWYQRLQAGDPYDQRPEVLDLIDEITTHHSSYYIDHSVTPAPLLISHGGTDDLHPVDEAVSFYNRTRAEHPDADIALFFLDYGHRRGQNKSADVALLKARQDAWFDFYLRGAGPTPFHGIEALTQTCPSTAPSEGPFSAPSWVELAAGEVRASSAAAQTILPGAGDVSRNNIYDPIFGDGACATAPGSDQVGVASYRLAPAPAAGFTLLGSPTIVADVDSQGATSQIAARLLDVAPDGTATLVARGLYRPEITAGVGTRQVFQLHPNGYRFGEGHVAKLELLPDDYPYANRSNGQSAITVSNLELRLPVLESPDGTLVLPPAPKVVPPGYALAACASDGDCDDGNACTGVERCVGHACVAGTPLGCNDGDVCTADACDPAAGCVHTPSCEALAISAARIRAGTGRARVQVTGTFATPPALSRTPPIAVEIADGARHVVRTTFMHCKGRGRKTTCSDRAAHLVLKGARTVRFELTLRRLTLEGPFAGPLNARLRHDGVTHDGSVTSCVARTTGLRCTPG